VERGRSQERLPLRAAVVEQSGVGEDLSHRVAEADLVAVV